MTSPFGQAELPDSLRLPSGPVEEILPPESLVHAVRADRTGWEVAGRRARIRLGGVQGVEAIEGDGVPLTGAVEVVGGVGANLLLGPRTTRREVMFPGGGVRETALVPDALPGVVLQWSATSPSGPRVVPLHIRLPDPPSKGGVHRGPGTLWIGRPGAGVLLYAPGCEASAELVEDGDHWAIRWDLPLDGGPASVLVLSAPPGERWASVTALAGVGAHHRRGEIVAVGRGEPGIVLETGVEDLDQGLLWTRAWLRDRLLTPSGSAPRIHGSPGLPRVGDGLPAEAGTAGDAPAWIARAATVSGDWEAARGALESLRWDTPWSRLHAALALARYAAWTGDGRPLEGAADAVRACFSDARALSMLPEPVVVAVWETVQSAAEAVEVAALAGLPRPAPPPPADRSRQLPVLGAGAPPAQVPSPASEHPWLPRLGFRQLPEAVLAARTALGGVREDPRRLADGLGVRAALDLVEGLLGAVPDATFSRLALSPLLPPSWTAFRVQGIRTGEGILQLDYRREGERAVWTLVPREGSVPLTAIFRPWLPWSRVGSVRVDDQDAALDVETVGGWSRLQVQIPVDGEHTVEVEGEGPRADTLPGTPDFTPP